MRKTQELQADTALSALGLASLLMAAPLAAHQEGAPFSGAIIDPLEVHHAHIEDEQRLNFVYSKNLESTDGDRDAFGNSLELAWNWGETFRWGTELIVPFSDGGSPSSYGIGDIEFQPVKYAFLNRPERIATAVLGFRLPTGDEAEGLGEGALVFEPHLFFDQARRNWFFGLNLVPTVAISGGSDTGVEYGAVVSYSFLQGEHVVAPTEPDQTIVPAASLEVLGESILAGANQGESLRTAILGLNLWHPRSGWSVRFGVEVPLGSNREADTSFLVQLGNHVRWKRSGGHRGDG